MNAAPRVVRLVGVPVREYLRLHAHDDAVLRELTLLDIQARSGAAIEPDVAAVLSALRRTGRLLTSYRNAVGAQAQAAADEGRAEADVEVVVEAASAADLDGAIALFDDIDRLATADRLLAPPTPPHLVELRRRLAREALAQLADRAPVVDVDLAAVVAAITDAVIVAGADGRIAYANPAAGELLGYPPGAVLGQPVSVLIPARFQSAHDEAFDRYLSAGARRSGGAPFRVSALRSDGVEVAVEVVAGTIGAGEAVVATIRPSPISIEDVERLARRRLALYHAARALSGSATVNDAAVPVLQALAEGFDWELANLWVVDRDTDTMRWAAAWSDPGAAPDGFAEMRAARFDRGVGLPGRVWSSAKAVWIEELAADTNFPRAPAAAAYGIRSAACFPVSINDDVVAVVEVFSLRLRPYDADELGDMTAFATQLGQFIDRRRVEEEHRLHRALLESQAEASIDGIVVVSLDGRVLFHNRRYIEITGIDPALLAEGRAQAVLDWSIGQLADPAQFLANLEVLRSDHTRSVRQVLHLRDGRILDSHTAQLLSDQGDYYGRAWFLRDVTAQRRDEERVRQLAETLQSSLLPPVDPEIPGLDIGATYVPATVGVDVGGDFYDVFPTAWGWGAVIGDVSGKGAEAARVTALVRYAARAAAMSATVPSDVLRVINETVFRGDHPRFCTAMYVAIDLSGDRARLTLAAGGHPLARLVRPDGSVVVVGEPGTLLGAFEHVTLADTSIDLEPGDVLVLYTDGVTEARSGGRFFGSGALHDVLAGAAGASAQAVADRVRDAALGFQGGNPRDDIAVLAIRVPA